MAHKKSIIPVEAIERRILLIRRQKVMLDSDLAQLYGVSTKRLNEQVKRNRKRFPSDFMFQLSEQEKSEVVANCDHLKNLKFSPVLPRAFTEHGAIMLASILNSSTAVEVRFLPVKCSTKQLNKDSRAKTPLKQNPKSEYLNPKQIQPLEFELPIPKSETDWFRILCFLII